MTAPVPGWMTALAQAPGSRPPWDRDAPSPGTPAPRGDTRSARQRTAVAVPRKTPRWRRNRKARRSARTLGMPRSARAQRAPGRRCHCRGAHLVRMARRRHPPNCGVTTCRRPCSAASWTRKSTPSHSPGSPQPRAALAARRPRAAASLRNPFSRPRPPTGSAGRTCATGNPAGRSRAIGNRAAGPGPTAVRAIGRGARGRGGTHDASGQRGAGGRGGTHDASGQRGAGGRVRVRAAGRAGRTCSDRA